MKLFKGALLLAFICAAGPSLAQERHALVIGNSNYQHVQTLPNPRNDAETMAALFRSAGYSVELLHDAGISQLRRAIREFAEKIRRSEVAVIFYAGHGIEVNGTNFLIPVDAKLAHDFDVEDETVPLDRLLQAVDPARRLRLIILDACRDNPFIRSMKRTFANRSIGRGLSPVDPGSPDTLIAFAAKGGSTAADGTGRNSPYTAALSKHLAVPGLDLRIALGRVRDEVMSSTNRRQEPFVYGSLGGSVVSLTKETSVAQAPTVAPVEQKRSNSIPESLRGRTLTVMINEVRVIPASSTIPKEALRGIELNLRHDGFIATSHHIYSSTNYIARSWTAQARPEEADNGIFWNVTDSQITGTIATGGYTIKTAIKINGENCTAEAAYQLPANYSTFKIAERQGTLIDVISMKADKVSCRIQTASR